ncbi:hypothetical protein C2857_006033 [Epichloe festucae Fl1]|uniref:Uncharacterized protein n=1 Tax=Epichloe festucae (strain Fl1) TaxID=877507 RepID=A0A7S9KLC8_EPIFF|nr:hypothetical protein C2857_006033 [Epichloe festucae Fl1]
MNVWTPSSASSTAVTATQQKKSHELEICGQAGHDWGQQTLLDNAKKCLGLGVTMWRFDYFDKPDENGMEWESEFNTPIVVKGRWFDNEKVVKWGGEKTRSINKGENKGCGFF